jgi:acyl carrier protein
MADSIADRVRTIVASAAKLPPSAVRLDSSFDDLGISWLNRIEITFELEKALELPFDTIDETIDGGWVTVADVVTSAEQLLAKKAAAAPHAGRAA